MHLRVVIWLEDLARPDLLVGLKHLKVNTRTPVADSHVASASREIQ